jgi:hypothetical protein
MTQSETAAQLEALEAQEAHPKVETRVPDPITAFAHQPT